MHTRYSPYRVNHDLGLSTITSLKDLCTAMREVYQTELDRFEQHEQNEVSTF